MSILKKIKFMFEHPVVCAMYVIIGDRTRVYRAQAMEVLPGLVEDLEGYLRLPWSEIYSSMISGQDSVTRQWRAVNPQTTEDILNFYAHCSEYIYDLAWWHLQKSYQQLLHSLEREHDGVCLPFGGGIGCEALQLAAQGNRVWYCDIPDSPVWHFAKWRDHHRATQIHFTAEISMDVIFDAIVAFDVFEHLTQEQLALVFPKLASSLKSGGRLYCRNSFAKGRGHCLTHPMHFDHSALWNHFISRCNLERVDEYRYIKVT